MTKLSCCYQKKSCKYFINLHSILGTSLSCKKKYFHVMEDIACTDPGIFARVGGPGPTASPDVFLVLNLFYSFTVGYQ